MWTSIEILNLAWTQLWQVTLVAVLVGLISHLLKTRRWHPSISNSLWLLVLAKALTPPLWASPFGVFSWTEQRTLLAANVAPQGGTSSNLIASLGGWTGILLGTIGVIWLVGFLGILCTQISRWRRLQRLIKEHRLPEDPCLTERVQQLAKRLRFRSAPQAIVTNIELGPALVGIWRPVIVLPSSLVKVSTWTELEPIVAHELLHLRRRDTAISGLQLIANAIWWFHPLVHWAGKQVEEASERCVDLAVLHVAGCDPSTYCRTLLKVLESRSEDNQCLMIVAPAVRGVSVTCERVQELVQTPARPRIWQRGMNLAFVAIMALFLLPGQPLSSLKKRCYSPDESAVVGDSVESKVLSIFYRK